MTTTVSDVVVPSGCYAKARRSLLMMVSLYDVNFHAWIIKGDSMEACSIPITARLRDHFPV
jgi:hypothetical protein